MPAERAGSDGCRPSAGCFVGSPTIRQAVVVSLLLVAREASAATSVRSRFAARHGPSPLRPDSAWLRLRGGSAEAFHGKYGNDDDDEEKEGGNGTASRIEDDPLYPKLREYRMKQQSLLQIRGTILAEEIARRGLPVPTIKDVATPEGQTLPKTVDWDCAISTKDEPKRCMYTFNDSPGAKLIAPIDTDNWISLRELNVLRRNDPTKVESMWHFKYAILDSWFSARSEFSILQHVGLEGFLLNALLEGSRLYVALAVAIATVAIVCMPVLEYAFKRFLVSSFFWSRWASWARYVHAALPLKLMLAQFAAAGAEFLFKKLAAFVKDQLVELESEIIYDRVPLTVGPGSDVPSTEVDRRDYDDTDGSIDLSEYEDAEQFDGEDDSIDEYFEESDDE